MLEICPALASKGESVLSLLSSWPEAVPVYIGDDETDEDAFKAVAGMGFGVLVSPIPRQTAAQFRLKSPNEVVSFLVEIMKERFPASDSG